MLYVDDIIFQNLTFSHLRPNLELWITASVFNYVCESITDVL